MRFTQHTIRRMEPARNAHSRQRIREGAALPAFVALCLAVAATGGAITATSVTTWYVGLAKPAFNPPEPGVRSGVDHALSDHDRRRLARVAPPRLARSTPRAECLGAVARAQPRLVVPVLRRPSGRHRARRDRAAAGNHHRHGSAVLAHRPAGRRAVRFLCRMGRLCHGAECSAVADELACGRRG